MAPKFLHGLFELLAGLVPLVDSSQEILLVHLAPHDQVGVSQVIQLLAGAVGSVLQVKHQLLQVLLLQVPQLQGLLLLLQYHLAVRVLYPHILDLGLDGELAGTHVLQDGVCFHFVVTWRADGGVACGLGGHGGVGRTHGDAHVVLGELVAGEHLGPGEAERLHDGGAAVADRLAQPAARVDGVLQTDGGKEGAEEDLRALVAVLQHQRHPAARLLLDLGQGLVLQQVGQQHLVVTHAVAELQVVRYVHALWGLAIDASAIVEVRLPAHVFIF